MIEISGGAGVLEINPFCGGEWVFSGATFTCMLKYISALHIIPGIQYNFLTESKVTPLSVSFWLSLQNKADNKTWQMDITADDCVSYFIIFSLSQTKNNNLQLFDGWI